MKEPTAEEYEKIYKEFMWWLVDTGDKSDPPQHAAAADVLLMHLRAYCTHPCRFYSYQLENLTFLVRELLQQGHDVGLSKLPSQKVFVHYFCSLLKLCNAGQLSDSRHRNN